MGPSFPPNACVCMNGSGKSAVQLNYGMPMCPFVFLGPQSTPERGWPSGAGRFRRGPTQGAAANGHARAMMMMMMTVMEV